MKYTPFTLGAAAALLAAQVSAQDECSGVVVEPTAVEYPLYISTYIADATVLNINNNINITIDNAPTNIEILTTGTSTVYNTVTATTTTTAIATPTVTTVDEAIILGINAGLTKKRQNAFSGFLGASAGVASSCSDAITLTLNAGNFYLSSGAGQFSTSPDVTEMDFAASADVGTISTTFGLDNGFVWVNSHFTNGSAIFCVSSAGTVRAAFDGVLPDDCTSISFTAILASSCSNSTSNSTTSSAALSTSITATSSSSLSFTSSTNLTTSSSSSSSSSSSTSSSATSTTSYATTSVSLSFTSPTAATKKRDVEERGIEERATGATEYVKDDGTFSTDAADAAVFIIVNGQLFVNGVQFSTSADSDYEVFAPISPVGDITRTFDAAAGPLLWTNSSFTINTAGDAVFAISSTTIYAAFQTIPPGATTVVLTAAPYTTATTTSSSSSSSTSSSVTSSATNGTAATRRSLRVRGDALLPIKHEQ